MRKRSRLAVMPLAAAAGVVLAIMLGSAPAAPARTTREHGRLHVGVEVLRFAAAGRKVTGTGLVTATLTDNQGHRSTTRTRVAIVATTGGGCRVLHLYLKELTLSLLGLNAHLDRVVLDITGDARGGVLGSLFCKLAHAKVASARASAVRALNAAVSRHRGHVMAFTANVSPKATASSANPTCQVLDLVVGPLNLQLLGLVVNLNRVHLTVTATRGQGVLGDLFCTLADNNTSGASSTGTSTGSTSTTTTSSTATT